jgi:peptidoglycan hydrolase-like protein with peptidoglycan-binding domain
MAGNVCVMNQRRSIMTENIQVGGAVISGPVGQGGTNNSKDVVLVQSLLNAVRALALPGLPPLKVDGLVGPLTIAAINRFQKATLGFSDGRVDPAGRTLARLNVLPSANTLDIVTSGRGQSLVGDTPAPTSKTTPLQAAMDAVPQAKLWTSLAIAHVDALKTGLILSNGIVFLPEVFAIANTHFHLDRDPNNLLSNVGKIGTIFRRIAQVLADPNRFFREGASTAISKFADAPTGGFSSSAASDVITFRTEYPDCGPFCRSAMIVHEGAHYCGAKDEIIHFAHEFPKFAGEPQDKGTNNYENMPTSEALRNAASYAAFAIHVTFQQDLRFGLDDKNK